MVIQFRKTSLEKKQWVYPLLLATFPVYYWIFALYDADYSALFNEVLVGIVFIVLAYAGMKFGQKWNAIVLAIGYLLHAVYDVFHNVFFINNGTPLWWPTFCAAADILFAVYLIYFALSLSNTVHTNDADI